MREIPISAKGRRKPRPRSGRRAHKPKASCAVVSDRDQIPVARFSQSARAGTTVRNRIACRSDHRNASICSTRVGAERSANISVENRCPRGQRRVDKPTYEEAAIFARSHLAENPGSWSAFPGSRRWQEPGYVTDDVFSFSPHAGRRWPKAE